MDNRTPPESLASSGEKRRTFEYTYSDETPASIAVIQAICAIEGVDPVDAPSDLGFTLFEHVDPGSLDTMIGDGTGDGDVVVTLTIDDYRVSIADTGRVDVRWRE